MWVWWPVISYVGFWICLFWGSWLRFSDLLKSAGLGVWKLTFVDLYLPGRRHFGGLSADARIVQCAVIGERLAEAPL